MRRTRTPQTKKATAILAADLHIRSDVPMCRTDDYLETQFSKLEFIFQICKNNECPLLVAGDIGNKSQWPNWLLEKVIALVNKYEIDIVGILGQHDLPEHRLDYWLKSGCGVLHSSMALFIIQGELTMDDICTLHPFSYGKQITDAQSKKKQLKVAMTHQMVIENKPLWPGQKAPKGNALLKKLPGYSLILCGDNHTPFVAEYDGRLLVNPGSMMRMTAAQIDHKPRVYKWFADTNTVETVYLPIKKSVVNRVHIEDKQERDKRMEAFVSRISSDIEIGLSFESNLEEYFNSNRTKESVRNKIWRAMEI